MFIRQIQLRLRIKNSHHFENSWQIAVYVQLPIPYQPLLQPPSRERLLVDPSLSEEGVMEGQLVIAMNVHREICALQMTGGVAIEQDQVS